MNPTSRDVLKFAFMFAVLFSTTIKAQFYFSLENKSENRVVVENTSKKVFKYPWAGGMNSCQFNQLDLNLDGKKDLLVFDRIGNRIIPFINEGSSGETNYQFAPEYISAFPGIRDWVILRDYNNDGLEDIFTYAWDYPGIIVYKNVSQSNLAFEIEVYPYLTSFQGGGYVNILTTNVDYPGIDDIDGDGDLDILTFWGLGSFVEYHQNQSMELYGIPDSLEYIEVTQCWGEFAESDESNLIFLDTCWNQKQMPSGLPSSTENERTRHTGSTFLLLDRDADNDLDLLLGDVDYPNPIELINGGDSEYAFMVSQNESFPSENKPVNLFSMPVSAYIDINNDNVRDLLLSPFDPNPFNSANHRSVWLYKNEGADNLPAFNFEMDDFLQNDMIDVGSGACPVLADYNGDGLIDLFVSNYGYYMYSYYLPGMLLHSVYWSNIALFENTGTLDNPQFSQVTHDFANLHQYHLTGIYPTFGDIDGDDDQDMIFGYEDGSLVFMENIAGTGHPMEFNEPVFDYENIDAGKFSAPQLFDLDSDGLLDLIIGEEDGNLNYYRNIGTEQNPEFLLETDSLGKVDVRNPEINYTYTGYSNPCFFLNPESEIELLVGSEQGKVFYFTAIEENLQGAFVENDSLYLLLNEDILAIDEGYRSAAAIGELNNDGFYELLTGNFSGGLHFYKGTNSPGVAEVDNPNKQSIFVEIFPNPAKSQFTIQIQSKEKDLYEVKLIDLYGISRMDFVLKGNDRLTINVEGFIPGVFNCLITSVKTKKVIHSQKVILF